MQRINTRASRTRLIFPGRPPRFLSLLSLPGESPSLFTTSLFHHSRPLTSRTLSNSWLSLATLLLRLCFKFLSSARRTHVVHTSPADSLLFFYIPIFYLFYRHLPFSRLCSTRFMADEIYLQKIARTFVRYLLPFATFGDINWKYEIVEIAS